MHKVHNFYPKKACNDKIVDKRANYLSKGIIKFLLFANFGISKIQFYFQSLIECILIHDNFSSNHYECAKNIETIAITIKPIFFAMI